MQTRERRHPLVMKRNRFKMAQRPSERDITFIVGGSTNSSATESCRIIGERHLAPAGEFGRPDDQVTNPRRDQGLLFDRQRGNDADREHAIDDDLLGRPAVSVLKASFHERAEAIAGKPPPPLLGVIAWNVAFVRPDDFT